MGPNPIFFKDFYLFIFRQRGREGEREREKHPRVVASCAPPTGDLATTLACALIGNRTSDPLIRKPALNHLISPTPARAQILIIFIHNNVGNPHINQENFFLS